MQRTAELEKSNRELEAFSYSIAHDLRAPLAALAGFSQALVEMEPTMSAKGRHWLNRIKAASHQMDEMTSGLLRLAQLTRVPLNVEAFDLSLLAREVILNFFEQDPGRDVRVSIKPRLRSEGDPALVKQVLRNLIGNAWKFTAKNPGACIEFGSSADSGGEQVYFVKDTGVGFDMEHATQLFRVFQRFHTSKEFEGTGIGLATVHKIVTRHGGRIWAQAQRGAGATFFFTLAANQESDGCLKKEQPAAA